MSTRCTVSIFNAPCLIEVHYVDMRRPLSEWYPSWRHQCNLPIWAEQMPIRNEKRCSILWTKLWTAYVPFLSVMKFVSAVPPYRLSFDFIRIGMLKLSLLRRRLYCWAQNVQFVDISVVKSSGFWVQSWFSGLTWVSFRTCHAFVFECWELLC